MRKLSSSFPVNPLVQSSDAPCRRSFTAAKTDNLTAGWLTTPQSADTEIRVGLRALRTRSRNLAINNDYAKRFLKLVVTNVVGEKGIIFKNKAKDPDGKGGFKNDAAANAKIEEAWAEWGKKGNCDVTGQFSWKDLQRLIVETVARDGEVLIRKVKAFKNKYRFALQVLETDFLDETHNATLQNGNIIRMSIEFDAWFRPVAYYIRTKNPADFMLGGYTDSRYIRIPVDEMIHLYYQGRSTQSRGVPWMSAAMTRLNMLGGYEEAEIVAARIGASKMGIITTPTGTEYKGDDMDAAGNVLQDASPGEYRQLPAGYDFKEFNPTHPGGNFGPFMKSVLRGISSGLNVSYNSLASDLEGVNYSSIRAGLIDERDHWKTLQDWMIENLCNEVSPAWLEMALLSGAINLPIEKFDKFNAPVWRPRRWDWVDPLKDQMANIEGLKAGFISREDIAAEEGKDLDELFQQLVHEKELLTKHGLVFDLSTSGNPAVVSTEGDASGGITGGQADGQPQSKPAGK